MTGRKCPHCGSESVVSRREAEAVFPRDASVRRLLRIYDAPHGCAASDCGWTGQF